MEKFDTAELHALLVDLDDTMRALNGAGLAAPQIRVGLQVVVFGSEHNPRYPDTILQLLSLTLFEKTSLNQLLSNIEPDTDTTTNSNQLDLFT